MFNNIQEIKTGVFTASLPTGIEVIVKNNVREDEIRILRLLQDGYHIIRILPQADPNLVVMMQEGYDLLSVKELSSSYRHSYTQSIMWIKSMASAVQHCHRHNIAHMDLSLENFVISKTSGMPILIDFGLSKSFDPVKRYHINSRQKHVYNGKEVGKVRFMSPELYRLQPTNAFAHDIYSLGICFLVVVFGLDAHFYNIPDDARFKFAEFRLREILIYDKIIEPQEVIYDSIIDLIQQMIYPQLHRMSISEVCLCASKI